MNQPINPDDRHAVIQQGLLNPALDFSSLAAEFKRKGRLQIPDALRPEVAAILRESLLNEVPWALAYRDLEGPKRLWADELKALGDADLARIEHAIEEAASAQFSFRYHTFMMVSAYREKRNPELPLHRLFEQINSPPWINFMRLLTGIDGIRRTDAQATCYRAGDFLKYHDDSDASPEEGRQVAYVINLSKDWQAHWGGLLQFIDDEGRVIDTLVPRYNTISMFRVPAAHVVSQVATWCPTERLAITGWLRT